MCVAELVSAMHGGRTMRARDIPIVSHCGVAEVSCVRLGGKTPSAAAQHVSAARLRVSGLGHHYRRPVVEPACERYRLRRSNIRKSSTGI